MRFVSLTLAAALLGTAAVAQGTGGPDTRPLGTTRRGAERRLYVRCAAYNDTLGIGFGQHFQAANDPDPSTAIAA